MSPRMNRKRLPRVLSGQEATALIDQANTDCPTGVRNRALLMTLYRAGLRVGEACALTPTDLPLRNGAAHITVRHGKGDRDRNVPIGDSLRDDLLAWDAIRPDGLTFFCSLKAKPLSTEYARQMTKRYAARAGIDPERVSPHVLRHSYATDLLSRGVDVRRVQRLLGHTSLATTEVYLHVNDEELAEEIRGLDGY